MDSNQEFFFEVPLEHEVEMVQSTTTTSPKRRAVELKDQDDCTIIEPKNSQEYTITSNSKETGSYKNTNTTCNNNFNKQSKNLNIQPSIDLDEDDCTIIDDHINFSRKNHRKNIRIFPESLKIKLKQQTEQDTVISTTEFGLQGDKSISNKKSDLIENNDETIVIEDSEKDNDCDIIESNQLIKVTDNFTNENASAHHKNVVDFEEILLKEKILAQLIEKCLDMENSSGMLRIVNRTLIPIYKDTSEDFKKSDSFQRFLTNTLRKLEMEPNRKFLHLKQFCEYMKTGKVKKRVDLTTLATQLNGMFTSTKTSTKSPSHNTIPRKKKKLDVINIDDDDDDGTNNDIILTYGKKAITDKIVIPMNAIDSHINETNILTNHTHISRNDIHIPTKNMKSNEMEILIKDVRSQVIEASTSLENNIGINDCENNNNIEFDKFNNRNDPKENEIPVKEEIERKDENSIMNDVSKNDNDVILIEDENDNSNKENITLTLSPIENVPNTQNDTSINPNVNGSIDIYNETENSNKVFNIDNIAQQIVDELTTPEPEQVLKLKIKNIEDEIKRYNDMIKVFENSEIDWEKDDYDQSPYVQCEIYKSKVVNLYKDLCRLTGTEAIKRRKVRLKAVDGRPEGPVRFLEEFINSNIDDSGNPPFPDMHDVVNCVNAANTYYQLGWGKKEIEMEARALFIHYGRTVQKKRQKREWRHLIRYTKKEIVDPADTDASLQARLQENAKLALKNEKDLFDKYAEMDSHRTTPYEPSTSTASIENNHNIYNDLRSENVSNNVTVHKNANVPNSVTVTNNVDSESVSKYVTEPNSGRLRINSYQESCSGRITNNVQIYPSAVPSLIMTPIVVPVSSNLIVDQNMLPVLCIATNTAENLLLNNAIPYTNNITEQNVRDTSEETNQSSNNANDIENNAEQEEREMIQVDIDMNLNLEDLNNAINQTKSMGSNQIEKFEDNIESETNCNAADSENGQENENTNTDIHSEQEIDVKPNITDIEINQTTSIQDKEVTTNSDTITNNIIENNEVTSSSEDCADKSCETENVAGLLEMDPKEKFNDEIVKKEPLDIPRMLAELGDNFTVSIMDIEDPFEIIEISDSSESEDEGV